MRALVLLLLLPITNLYAYEDSDQQAIYERIKPVGQVKVQEDVAPVKEAPVETAAASAPEVPGQKTYEQYCSTCHRNGVAGAPEFRTADWKPRLEMHKLDGLVGIAMKGINAMPPKGTCADCSEKEIKEAIQYMLPQ